MEDDSGGGLSAVDQGTVLMFSLTLGMAAIAAVWFTCKWYIKRASKHTPRIIRPRLKQTFSRFSEVDEELTMHQTDEHDAELLKAFSTQSIDNHRNVHTQSIDNHRNVHKQSFDNQRNVHTQSLHSQRNVHTGQHEMHQTLSVSQVPSTITASAKPYLETDI